MRKALTITLLSTLFCMSTGVAQTLEKIQWMTEEYPPYNFVENNLPKGISVDLLLAVWKKAGLKKTAADINFVPWARGVKTLNLRPNTCLFSTSLTEERKTIFGWKYVYPIPLINPDTDDHIIARKDKNIKFNSVDDFKKYNEHFGVIRGDVGATLLIENGVVPHQLDKAASPELLIKKLYMGRHDVISYSFSSTITQLKEAGQDPGDYEIVFSFPAVTIGYAFNKDVNPDIITRLQTILNELHRDGTAEKIRQKYNRPKEGTNDPFIK